MLGDKILLNLLYEQITSLIIDVNDKTDESHTEYYSLVFHLILEWCQRLNKLHFCSYYYRWENRPVYFSSFNCKSTILTELKVNINCFDECLYLFDGHFPSLSILILNVEKIGETSRTKTNTVSTIFFRKEKN